MLCLTDLSSWTEMEGMGNGGNQGLAIFDWQQVQSVIWEAEPGMLGDGCYEQTQRCQRPRESLVLENRKRFSVMGAETSMSDTPGSLENSSTSPP